jgi:chemotaxis family two-component system response regulator Rcp1
MDRYKAAIILLVEDDIGDQKLAKQALCSDKVGNDVIVKNSAEEALGYLEKSKQNQPDCPMPDLILLDLNMPGMGGKGLLKELGQDSILNSIPVVILTTSDSDRDVLESFQLQAAGYIQKPATLQCFKIAMNDLTDYWFVICRRIEHSKEGSSFAAAAVS